MAESGLIRQHYSGATLGASKLCIFMYYLKLTAAMHALSRSRQSVQLEAFIVQKAEASGVSVEKGTICSKWRSNQPSSYSWHHPLFPSTIHLDIYLSLVLIVHPPSYGLLPHPSCECLGIARFLRQHPSAELPLHPSQPFPSPPIRPSTSIGHSPE
jgi:hypothetical protein